MQDGGVLLIAMPWQALQLPSIQLGILKSVLERAGIRAQTLSLALAFMEHCRAETRGRAPEAQIGLADYEAVATHHYGVGMGDWIFAVPPFRDALARDAEYLEYLRSSAVPERDVVKAEAMRSVVPTFLEQCAGEVLAASPRVVGFTTTFRQNVPSLVLAKMLKARDPSLRVVFGGANCDGPMGAALHRAFPWIDALVRGEAECVLPDVVRDLLGGDRVRPRPGLCFRDERGESVAVAQGGGTPVPMDEVPTPTYDEYFERLAKTSFADELSHQVAVPYETARGCWWGAVSHCVFCGLNGTSMTFRSKSPDRVLDELATLARRHERLEFQMVDNIIDLRYLRDLLPRLRDAGVDLSLFYETKANLKREHLRLMREAGVERIQPGIESLSTPILGLMRKGVTALQNIRLLKWAAEYGLRVYWNIIYGLPGEPPEEYARMAEIVPSLAHLEPPTLGPLGLDRFSPYHEQPGEYGLEVRGPLPYYPLIYPVDATTLDDLAYAFEYRYTDGRDPESYVAPLRHAIKRWQASRGTGFRSLRYRRGFGFLTVRDRRSDVEPADYTFGEREALIFLACEDGATPAEARAAMQRASTDVSVEEIREFLDGLVASRLVYEEHGRYLALALPARLPEAV